jgi:glutamate synthase (ferredoxin)
MRAQGLYDPQYEHDACGIGAVVHIKGKKSHDILRKALKVLENLDHRGAAGAESNTGDGAGVLFQIPHAFFSRVTASAGFKLPSAGDYGVAMTFLPKDEKSAKECQKKFENIVREEGQIVLGWRDVPTNNSKLGKTAISGEPVIKQLFIGKNDKKIPATYKTNGDDSLAFERKLYIIRKRAEHLIKVIDENGSNQFYIPSLSCRTIVYKGMLLSPQMDYFKDLSETDVETAIALVHSRFSTNTFPNWNRAHPYRYIIHNGEINTLRGNVNWMNARQALLESDVFGSDLKRLLPVVDPDGSDSAMFDNTLEFLVMAGRSLPHAMMMMIPEPWEKHESMSANVRAFYKFHACMIEPWDGPASVAFTDGTVMGATLDRNGLRPSRYYVTSDDVLVLASEAGVLEFETDKILEKGRLRPGKMLLVDTKEGRIIDDNEIKEKISSEHPYAEWLEKNLVTIESLPEAEKKEAAASHEDVVHFQKVFGYNNEDIRVILEPMAKTGVEPLGSMGTDTPLAVLSNKPRLLYDYFHQLFAQVTNPPIDCIREEIVTSAMTMLGAERNILNPLPESCKLIEIHYPILLNDELEKIRAVNKPGFKSETLPILFEPKNGASLEKALDKLFASADKALKKGCTMIILSDRNSDSKNVPIPALLAVAGLHHHLIRSGTRTNVSIILESGEPRTTHHFSLLIGYGCSAINPYLAFETIRDMIDTNILTGVSYDDAVGKYMKGCVKGVIKTCSKMGISTIQSYRGAQVFEALGLSKELVDKYFTLTATRIEGIGLDGIAEEVRRRSIEAFDSMPDRKNVLDPGGHFKWRALGEYHLFNPETLHRLQQSCRTGDFKLFREYTSLVDNQTKNLCTLRGMFRFKKRTPVPIDEVESVDSIVKRFKTGAMSYGSISQEAHEALAIAMNRLGGKSNTGEGGEDPERFTPMANGDSRNSAIKQVASGRFGVTSNYLVNAKEIQIKMAQGAKPGEGGQLPGGKVYPWVAKTRHTTAGVGLISPPPHHDIYSIEDLAELIHDLKNANDRARISVKLVSEVGVGTIAAGVAKAHADVILVSGFDGGTGASPLSSIKHAGLPWELGLAETHQTLVLNNLRSRVMVETDGQLKTGRDVVIAALLGAEEYGFATAPLVTLGCVMMRVCQKNTCSVGVATQDPALRAKFSGSPDFVVNFMKFIAQETRELMAELGFRTINEMIGHTECLEMNDAVEHWKAKGLNFDNIFYKPDADDSIGRFCSMTQDHGLGKSLDKKVLLDMCRPAIEKGEKVVGRVEIKNFHRVVGTQVGAEVSRKYGEEGLPDGTITLNFTGSAGQSFGAFVPKGMTLSLEGDANDYLGKGLSGGRIVIVPPKNSKFDPEENVIVGNVAFYGATSGEAFIRGQAGGRFCVRNSGVNAVVDGIGNHGCEYMTGGRVVVLGKIGRNFGAGMSGGIAYLLDEDGSSMKSVNTQMVEVGECSDEDLSFIKDFVERHVEYTGSVSGRRVLSDWNNLSKKFIKVIPHDYKRMLACIKRAHDSGLSGDDAIMAAFAENAKDLSRVGGN